MRNSALKLENDPRASGLES